LPLERSRRSGSAQRVKSTKLIRQKTRLSAGRSRPNTSARASDPASRLRPAGHSRTSCHDVPHPDGNHSFQNRSTRDPSIAAGLFDLYWLHKDARRMPGCDLRHPQFSHPGPVVNGNRGGPHPRGVPNCSLVKEPR
jgi:hypothetical protein